MNRFLGSIAKLMHHVHEHYVRHYHRRYVHAKKLLLFDVFLLGFAALLFGTTIAWFTYDPTVLDAVNLSLTVSPTRLISGENTAFEVRWKNASGVALKEARLYLPLPQGFIDTATEGSVPTTLTPQDVTVNIGNLPDGAEGKMMVRGRYFGTPEKPVLLNAHLTYRQEQREVPEEKIAGLVMTLRGSLLMGNLTIPSKGTAPGILPISFTLHNTGDTPWPGVTVPFPSDVGSISGVANLGQVFPDGWGIPILEPNQQATFTGTVALPATTAEIIRLSLTPVTHVTYYEVPQTTFDHEVTILRPNISVSATWQQAGTAKPGDVLPLTIDIRNTGAVTVGAASIQVPLPAGVIDEQALRSKNAGTIRDHVFSIQASDVSALGAIAPGAHITIPIAIPILPAPENGSDLALTLYPRLRAEVADAEGAIFETAAETGPIRIGTVLIASGALRYYTVDGDQLGRGPLPPEVGEKTKYWVFLTVKNTTSLVRDITLSGNLAPRGEWTGKTSVSHGQNIIFQESSRRFSYTLPNLPPHDTVGVYFEIGYTPTPEDIGKTPVLIESVQVRGYDTYTDEERTAAVRALDTSLPDDARARSKGVSVTLPSL